MEELDRELRLAQDACQRLKSQVNKFHIAFSILVLASMIWTVNLDLSRSRVEISPRILIRVLGVRLQAFAFDLIFACKMCMENSPLRIFIGITFYFEFISSCCLLFWRNESFHIAVVCVLR